MNDKSLPNQDDRILAGLAHLSLIIPFMGLLAPVVIWATQKDKSEFVGFQALQALAYQLAGMLCWIAFFARYFCSFFISFAGTMLAVLATPLAETNFEELESLAMVLVTIISILPAFLPFAVFGCMLLLGITFVIYGIVGAVSVFQGKDFRYIVVGKRVEHFWQEREAAET